MEKVNSVPEARIITLSYLQILDTDPRESWSEPSLLCITATNDTEARIRILCTWNLLIMLSQL